jgi:hypothetical protein
VGTESGIVPAREEQLMGRRDARQEGGGTKNSANQGLTITQQHNS